MPIEWSLCTSSIYGIRDNTEGIGRVVVSGLFLTALCVFEFITIRLCIRRQVWRRKGLFFFYFFLGCSLLWESLYHLSGIIVCPSPELYAIIVVSSTAFKEAALLLLVIRLVELYASLKHEFQGSLGLSKGLLYALIVLNSIALYTFSWVTAHNGSITRYYYKLSAEGVLGILFGLYAFSIYVHVRRLNAEGMRVFLRYWLAFAVFMIFVILIRMAENVLQILGTRKQFSTLAATFYNVLYNFVTMIVPTIAMTLVLVTSSSLSSSRFCDIIEQ